MTLEEAAGLALSLPEVTEGIRFRQRTWFVAGKPFAWERPLSKADVKRLGGATPPVGALVAVRVANMDEKEVLLMDPPQGFFDIEHFRGFPAVLVQLEKVNRPLLAAAMADAWSACAPPELAASGPRRGGA